jgi:hypothetical protein
MVQGKAVHLRRQEGLKALPKVEEIIDITYTKTPTGRWSRPIVTLRRATFISWSGFQRVA